MQKQAAGKTEMLKSLLGGMRTFAKEDPRMIRVPAAAAAGGAIGYGPSPYMFGYENDPAARFQSGTQDALIAGLLASLGKGRLRAATQSHPLAPIGVAAAGPVAYFTQQRSIASSADQRATEQLRQEAARANERAGASMANAAQTSAKATQEASIPGAVRGFLRHPATIGAGVGAAGAGLAAILTGLARKRTEEEMKNRTSRMGMIGADTLKYVLPALIAGGVIGSFAGKK